MKKVSMVVSVCCLNEAGTTFPRIPFSSDFTLKLTTR